MLQVIKRNIFFKFFKHNQYTYKVFNKSAPEKLTGYFQKGENFLQQRLFFIYISGFHFLDSSIVVIWSHFPHVIFYSGAIYTNRERGV
ncbi:hypothetical protein T07_1416 [Trichinella nelsoni]|uniref:Uncharacterized protein n=1 Tax=Trichinella nelsoni TaxID=6336 RepID=A0A0V0S0Z0_9BILA|nr:hypothetical protein T07_1416 [Trichinella nelsoni]